MDNERRIRLRSKFERATELPLLLLALAIVPLILLPLLIDLSQTIERSFLAVDWTIWAIFALELSVRTYLSERRLHYLLRHWFDVLIVALPFLRPLRVVRSARALRLLRLARAGAFFSRGFHDARRLLEQHGLQYVLAIGVLAIFASAGATYLLERDSGGTIDDYGTALWWAVSTITTVGYGDAYPVSAEGRGVAVFLMLLGVGFFSWVTANVAAFLVEFGGRKDREVTLGELMDKLEALEQEIRLLRESKPA